MRTYPAREARHRCFVSHHSADKAALRRFKSDFDDVEDAFIFRGQSMPEDIVNSNDDEYVMRQLRSRFLANTTVTIVLIGSCTWSRKFIDWEVQASLRRPASGSPNGLLAILADPSATRGHLPSRVKKNVESGYCHFYPYPSSGSQLQRWIDVAFDLRRTSPNLIENPRARKSRNDAC